MFTSLSFSIKSSTACPVLLRVQTSLMVIHDVLHIKQPHDVLHILNCCYELRGLTQWSNMPSSSMVGHYLAQFLQPSCILLPKTETGVSVYSSQCPSPLQQKGGVSPLADWIISVCHSSWFLLHSSRLNYLSPQNILGASGHLLLQFFALFYHREEISSQKDSLTCTLRPQTPLPITCLRKPSLLSKILHFIVGTSNAVSAAMLEKCLGYFSPTLPKKLPTLPPGPQTCACVHAYSLIIGA